MTLQRNVKNVSFPAGLKIDDPDKKETLTGGGTFDSPFTSEFHSNLHATKSFFQIMYFLMFLVFVYSCKPFHLVCVLFLNLKRFYSLYLS